MANNEDPDRRFEENLRKSVQQEMPRKENPPQTVPARDYTPRGESKTRKAFRFAFRKVPAGVSVAGEDLLLLTVIAVHLVDVFVLKLNAINFDALFIRAVMYFILIILIRKALKEYTTWRELGVLGLIVVLFIPSIGGIMTYFGAPQIYAQYISGAFLIFPLFLLYLVKGKGLTSSKIWIANISNAWITFWFIVGVVYLLFIATQSFASTPFIENQQEWFSPRDAVRTAFEFVGGVLKSVYTSFGDVWMGIGNTTDVFLRQSLGEYYTGRVEENTERTGVFIEGFSTRETFYENHPVVIHGTLRARSFTDNISVTLSCEARDHRGDVVQGAAEPSRMVIYEQDQQIVFCNFDGLPAGNHEISLKAEFDFETWAYTTYTFMPRDLYRSITVAGDDINRKFNIERRPSTIYTSGPASLGMQENVELPIIINTDSDSSVPVGITLDNRYRGSGDIQRVIIYKMKLPEYFTLTDDNNRGLCTRNITRVEDAELEGYKTYFFENPSPELVQFYMSVSCNMRLAQQNVLPLMRNNLQSAMDVTIVGVAEYEYLLRGRTNIRVRPDPAAQVVEE